jgi:hypothetical protein
MRRRIADRAASCRGEASLAPSATAEGSDESGVTPDESRVEPPARTTEGDARVALRQVFFVQSWLRVDNLDYEE